jgi:hypothetical protein
MIVPIDLPCPFCLTSRGQSTGTVTLAPDLLAHSLPACREFIRLKPLAFIQRARRAVRRLSVN